MTEFAKAWSKYLPDNHRDALFSALCILADEFFDYELDNADHIFRELLPSKYLNLYDGLFLKRFYATLLTVGYSFFKITFCLRHKDPGVIGIWNPIQHQFNRNEFFSCGASACSGHQYDKHQYCDD